MATLLDLFKSQKKDLYGKSENIRIESRGLINPPRAAALLTSSPNALGDLIGNQIGGALKGSANRPSDTIFRGNSFLSKPISLFRTQSGLRNAVEADTSYYIKQSPAPASFIASLKQGGSSIGGLAANLAIKAITKGGLKQYADSLKDYSIDESFGTKYGPKSEKVDGKNILREDKLFSKYYKDESGKLTERATNKKARDWDSGINELLQLEKITETQLTGIEYSNHIITTFETIPAEGKTSFKVPFVGSISGISEDVVPSWNSFKYVGSPFSIYRYSGVERSLKFNLKLYYLGDADKVIMIKKINYLKSLAFPDSDIKTITSGGKDSQYAMAPNLVKVSIGSLYKNIPGYIESLSFQIDDNTVWPNPILYDRDKTYREKAKDKIKTEFLYPSIVDVSISMKIIETHNIESGTGTKTYRYNFDGLTTNNDGTTPYEIK
jgi:hypothetical protein